MQTVQKSWEKLLKLMYHNNFATNLSSQDVSVDCGVGFFLGLWSAWRTAVFKSIYITVTLVCTQTCWANCFQKPLDIRPWHSTQCSKTQTSVLDHYSTLHVLCSFQTFCSGNLIWFTLKLGQINVATHNLNTGTYRPDLVTLQRPSVLIIMNKNLKYTTKSLSKLTWQVPCLVQCQGWHFLIMSP